MFPLVHIWSDTALLVLRLVLGAIFLAHGWPKLKHLRDTMTNFDGMGFKPGWLWGTLTAFTEFLGGLAVLLGLGTQAVAALFVIEFLVIIVWKIARRAPFIGNVELDLVIFSAAVVLFVVGAGTLSLDFFLWGVL